MYILYKNYITSDSDGWNWWVEEDIISYHKTLEGANKKKEFLIQKEGGNNILQPETENEPETELFSIQYIELED